MVTRCAIYYSGIAAEGGGNFTLQPGISPSTAVIRFCLRETYPLQGQLLLTDGSISISFSRCRVVRESINDGTSGKWNEITIEDRRWKWADECFAIYGEYNRIDTPLDRQPNKLSLRALVALCLDALYEYGYDVSALPDNIYPSVIWDGANPAAEMEQLCQRFGFLVTLQATDTVRIVADGIGILPSTGDPRVSDFQYQREPPVIPAAFVVDGARTHLHHDLPLIPVGYETKTSSRNYGKFVHIDDLSYRPSIGWGLEDPFNFGTVLNEFPNDHATAKKYIWRTYQIGMPKGVASINLPIPPKESIIGFRSRGRLSPTQTSLLQDFFRIDDSTLHRILPLNQIRKRPEIISDYVENDVEPLIYGFFYSMNFANRNSTVAGVNSPTTKSGCSAVLSSIFDYSRMAIPDPPTAIYRQLVMDKQDIKEINWTHGRVTFNDPVYFEDSTDGRIPAPIRLRCSFPIRDPITMAAICPQFWFSPGNATANDVAKIVKDSTYGLEYSGLDSAGSQFDNADWFIAWATEIVKREMNRYLVSQGLSLPYKTFVFDVAIDGIAKTIVWDKAESGAGMTHIDYGMERPAYYLTLNERRLNRLQTYNILVAKEDERRRKRGYGSIRVGGNTP